MGDAAACWWCVVTPAEVLIVARGMADAEVLNGAADEIEERGHYKGDLGDPALPPEITPVCLIGALCAVLRGNPFKEMVIPHNLRAAIDEAAERHDDGEISGSIVDWNDAPERTADDVITVLREAAKLVTA